MVSHYSYNYLMPRKTLAYTISNWNRQRKYELFQKYFPLQKQWKILDIGVTEREYSESDNYLEKHYLYPTQITALAIEPLTNFKKLYPLVATVIYEGKIYPFPDKSYDLAWSNAVLEHVGNRDRQELFLKELVRTSKRAFITTPNRWFPFEIHTRLPFVHWLPKKIADRLFALFGKKWATGDYMNLLSYRDIKKLLKKTGTKNFEIHRNRLFGFTLDFVIILKDNT